MIVDGALHEAQEAKRVSDRPTDRWTDARTNGQTHTGDTGEPGGLVSRIPELSALGAVARKQGLPVA